MRYKCWKDLATISSHLKLIRVYENKLGLDWKRLCDQSLEWNQEFRLFSYNLQGPIPSKRQAAIQLLF